MKRIHRTLTAAALAGSLALGGTAVASAQIPAPAEFELDGVTYQKQADGKYKSTNEHGATTLTEPEAQAAWERLQEQQAGEETADAPASEETTETETAPTTTSVLASDVDMASTGESTAPSSVDYPLNGEPTSEFDKKQLAWLALPAALVIGGVTWYLAKDGKTYVKSEEAAQKSELSAEEKAESEQLLKDNHDEVIAQGGKVAQGQGAADAAQEPQVANRGISAETGSNTVARGLAALAIAAMLAAGAVVARRKQLF